MSLKGQGLPLQCFKSFKLHLKKVLLNSQGLIRTEGSRPWLFGPRVAHHRKVGGKRNADALFVWCPAPTTLFKALPIFSSKTEKALRCLNFEFFDYWYCWSNMLDRQELGRWGLFLKKFRGKERARFLRNPQTYIWETSQKAEGDFSFKLKNKKLTSRKCRVTAERLPQTQVFRFQITSP